MSQSKSASDQASVSQRKGRGLGCLAALLLLLVLVLVGGGIALYLTSPYQLPNPIQVNILAPTTGNLSEVNQPIALRAVAEHRDGVKRMEMYADGALVAVQESTLANGSNPLTMIQRWTPLTTGRHILMARAYDLADQATDSSTVYVDVLSLPDYTSKIDINSIQRGPNAGNPSLTDIASARKVPLERLREMNPGLGNVDPRTPLPAGTTVEIPSSPAPLPGPESSSTGPGGSGTSGDDGVRAADPIPGSPAAPTNLTAVPDCTTVQLTWTDSPDEESYIVYRLAPFDASRTNIASLPANTMTFRDSLTALGTYRYQIASVRVGLESATPMLSVRKPDGCVPPALLPGTSDLVLSLFTLETDEVFTGVYCYVSVDGSPFSRLPSNDFSLLIPDPSDPRGLRYNLQTQPAELGLGLGQIPLSGHSADAPVTISANCYGARGVERISLGVVSSSDPRSQWDGRELRAFESSRATLVAGTNFAPLAEPQRFHLRYSINSDTAAARREALRGIGIELPPEVFDPRGRRIPGLDPRPGGTEDRVLPAPDNLRIENTLLPCDEIADPRNRGLCALSIIVGGISTLTWNYPATAATLQESELDGYEVRYSAVDVRTGAVRLAATTRNVRPGTHKWMARPADLPCNSRVYFTVSAVASTGQTSMESQSLELTTPRCPGPSYIVEAEFVNLGVFPAPGRDNIEDVDGDFCFLCTDRRLELAGAFGLDRAQLETHGGCGPGFNWTTLLPGILVLGIPLPNPFDPSLGHHGYFQPLCGEIREQGLALDDQLYARDSSRVTNRVTEVVDSDARSVFVWFGLNELDDDGHLVHASAGCVARREIQLSAIPLGSSDYRLNTSVVLDGLSGIPQEGLCRASVVLFRRPAP